MIDVCFLHSDIVIGVEVDNLGQHIAGIMNEMNKSVFVFLASGLGFSKAFLPEKTNLANIIQFILHRQSLSYAAS